MGCSGGGPPVAARIEPAGRKVFCVKFLKEMPGLSEVPFEGHPLGQKVYENVSKEGWSMWLEHMKMLMNESEPWHAGGAGTYHQTDGRLLLRGGLRASGWIRAAQGEGMIAQSHAACCRPGPGILRRAVPRRTMPPCARYSSSVREAGKRPNPIFGSSRNRNKQV